MDDGHNVNLVWLNVIDNAIRALDYFSYLSEVKFRDHPSRLRERAYFFRAL